MKTYSRPQITAALAKLPNAERAQITARYVAANFGMPEMLAAIASDLEKQGIKIEDPTAEQLQAMALDRVPPVAGTDLRDAIAEGSSIRESLNQMSVAATALRKLKA